MAQVTFKSSIESNWWGRKEMLEHLTPEQRDYLQRLEANITRLEPNSDQRLQAEKAYEELVNKLDPVDHKIDVNAGNTAGTVERQASEDAYEQRNEIFESYQDDGSSVLSEVYDNAEGEAAKVSFKATLDGVEGRYGMAREVRGLKPDQQEYLQDLETKIIEAQESGMDVSAQVEAFKKLVDDVDMANRGFIDHDVDTVIEASKDSGSPLSDLKSFEPPPDEKLTASEATLEEGMKLRDERATARAQYDQLKKAESPPTVQDAAYKKLQEADKKVQSWNGEHENAAAWLDYKYKAKAAPVGDGKDPSGSTIDQGKTLRQDMMNQWETYRQLEAAGDPMAAEQQVVAKEAGAAYEAWKEQYPDGVDNVENAEMTAETPFGTSSDGSTTTDPSAGGCANPYLEDGSTTGTTTGASTGTPSYEYSEAEDYQVTADDYRGIWGICERKLDEQGALEGLDESGRNQVINESMLASIDANPQLADPDIIHPGETIKIVLAHQAATQTAPTTVPAQPTTVPTQPTTDPTAQTGIACPGGLGGYENASTGLTSSTGMPLTAEEFAALPPEQQMALQSGSQDIASYESAISSVGQSASMLQPVAQEWAASPDPQQQQLATDLNAILQMSRMTQPM